MVRTSIDRIDLIPDKPGYNDVVFVQDVYRYNHDHYSSEDY